MDTKSFLKKLNGIDDLPTLPTIAMEANKYLQDYDTSIRKLSQIIEKDQAMVPRILKLVNSAFFGFRSKIGNISHAIILLGFNTVRNVVVSVSIFDRFSKKGTIENFDILEFWHHSIAVAVMSKHLAAATRCLSPYDAFTAGLLHDIGKLVLCQYFPDLFRKAWIVKTENCMTFLEAEKKIIPANHAEIGGYLAKKWQLPTNLIHAIGYHHNEIREGSEIDLLMIVQVADIMINNLIITSNSKPNLAEINSYVPKVIRPYLDTVSESFQEIFSEIQSASQLFLRN